MRSRIRVTGALLLASVGLSLLVRAETPVRSPAPNQIVEATTAAEAAAAMQDWATVRRVLAPQIETPPRFSDFREGRDRALEAALEIAAPPLAE